MLPQQKEFKAWGLSSLAIRNIVVFFICCLITAIAYLARVVQVQDTHNHVLNDKLVQCNQLLTNKVELLKDQQIAQMDTFYRRQELTNKKLQQINTILLQLRKNQ